MMSDNVFKAGLFVSAFPFKCNSYPNFWVILYSYITLLNSKAFNFLFSLLIREPGININ